MAKETALVFKTRYKGRESVSVRCPVESRTKQSFRDECDINNILKRFETTGQLPDLIKSNPSYGDFSDLPDYQSALNTVRKANEQFEALSSKVRERFNNDPAKFLDFANNPDNGAEMVSLGLATLRVDQTPSQPSSTPPKAGQADPDSKVNA